MIKAPGASAIVRHLVADPRRMLLLAAAAWLLGGALVLPPRSYGDGGEYHLTTESFVRHLSPEMRPGDVASLAAHDRRFGTGVDFAAVLTAYFEDRGGSWYAVHFWGYSIATAPARALFRLLALNDLRNAQLTNAALLLFALHQILFRAGFGAPVALVLGLLTLFSPAVWFMRWTHPEAFCFSLVMLALVWARSGRTMAAVGAAALASMQNPTLLWLVAPLWIQAWWGRDEARQRLMRASGVALPAALPALFYLWRFGVPSLIAREAAKASNLSAARAVDLFFDLNLGLFPYAPLTVLLCLLALPLSLSDRRWGTRTWGLATLAALTAWSCTATTTWNHGTSGPSRYGVWIIAFLVCMVAESYAWLLERGGPLSRRLATWAVVGAILTQAGVVFGRGGLDQPEDSETHSYAARLAFRYAPALYNPTPEIFVSRTLGQWHDALPAVYRDERGCRKAWLRPRDAEMLEAACGALPAAYKSFFEQSGRARRTEWGYVSYP
jgi:hypothetical protein